jgi:hypothetical protein
MQARNRLGISWACNSEGNVAGHVADIIAAAC